MAAAGEEILEIQVARAREARSLLDGELSGLPDVRRVAVFGDRLHLSVGSAERATAEVSRVLREAGFEVRSVRSIVPSLEDVFIGKVAEADAA
jgi:acetolactate synthase regulatory subunit